MSAGNFGPNADAQTIQVLPSWRRLARRFTPLIDLFIPPHCVLCGFPPKPSNDAFCPRCRIALLHERHRPFCPTCAATVAPYEVSNRRCSRCRGRPQSIRGIARIGAYRSILGRLIRAYKYRHREELTHVLGAWLASAISETTWSSRMEAVVAIPTHWRRRLVRPFYPAEALAAFLAKRLGLPNALILRRTRSGPHQVGLSMTARTQNVRGAFALRPGVRLSRARLLLVDDVRTTGATLNECARVLRRAGAAEIYAAVLARVDYSLPDSGILRLI